MLLKKEQIPKEQELDPMGGVGHLLLEHMAEALSLPTAVCGFSRATLAPGAEVGFHVHDTDAEVYYILSGIGEYCDGAATYRVEAGDVSYTPRGEGHGIKNAGNEPLIFIAMSMQ